MSLSAAFAAAASAASGVGNMVPAADPQTLTREELDRMEGLEVENSGEIEMHGIMYAIRRMGEHWDLLTSVHTASDLVLSSSREEDTQLYSAFRARFPAMQLDLITEDTLKDTRLHETWRDFLMSQAEQLNEHNMISLLRKDASLGYNDENTMLVPRAQFLCIEIARNRESVNDPGQLRIELLLDKLAERKIELQFALSEPDSNESLARHLRALAIDFPILPPKVLKLTGIGRFVHSHCVLSTCAELSQLGRALERQWKSGVVISQLQQSCNGTVADAAAYVIQNWHGIQPADANSEGGSKLKTGPVPQEKLELVVSAEERREQRLTPATVDLGVNRFEENGVVFIRSALSPLLLEHARLAVDGCCDFLALRLQQLNLRYAQDTFTFREVQYRDGARLDNRLLIGDTVCGSSLVANHPFWFPIVDRLLEGDANLLFSGVVEAYPYDRPHPQEWHRDGQALSADPKTQLPPHCINLFIPLVDITDDIGPTEFWPGTHVEATYKQLQVEQQTTATPKPEDGKSGTTRVLAPAGSIIMFDYRTIHRGAANKSGTPRRVLYLTYARKWFTDAKNFNAPSILEAFAPICKMVTDKASEAMDDFFHLLRRQQLGQDADFLGRLCEVGHARYTTKFGLILMKYLLANYRRAFMPYTDHQEAATTTDDSDTKAAGVAAAAASSALHAANGSNEAAVWASLMQGEEASDLQVRRYDVRLLQNIAACVRLQGLAQSQNGVKDTLANSIENFVTSINSPAAHQARLHSIASVYASRRRQPAGEYSEETSFRGGYKGYVFGYGRKGLGYYADEGGPPMSEEVKAMAKQHEILVAERILKPSDAVPEKCASTSGATDSGTVQVGTTALISWDDGQKYEAVVVQLEPHNEAVRWRYLPSAGWDAWEESIPLSMFTARGVEIIQDKLMSKSEVVSSSSAVLSSPNDDKSESEASEAHLDQDSRSPGQEQRGQDMSPQVEAVTPSSESLNTDFGDVNEDRQSMARLEDLAVSRASTVLTQHGFTLDMQGWTLFLAHAKASAHGTAAAAKLEESVSGWFHGGEGRFEMVLGSGSSKHATTLVIAFSSLGNGLVRPEFRGSLLPSTGGGVDFDVLFVLDPASSWYCQDPSCAWAGYTYYSTELRKRIEDGGYQQVLLLGDSMGGSAALTFSSTPPASVTTRVLAFVPQLDLIGYSQVTRTDFRVQHRQAFERRLLLSLEECNAQVTVHIGVDAEDERQASRLPRLLVAGGALRIVRHEHIVGHHVSGALKQEGKLVALIQREIAELKC